MYLEELQTLALGVRELGGEGGAVRAAAACSSELSGRLLGR